MATAAKIIFRIFGLCFKACALFCFIYAFRYFIGTSIVGLSLGIMEPYWALQNLLTGVMCCAIFALEYRIANSRVGALLSATFFIFWIIWPWNAVGGALHFTVLLLPQSFEVTRFFLFFFAVIGILGILVFIFGGFAHRAEGKSFFLGPWFQSARKIKLSREQMRKVKNGLYTVILALALIAPGLISMSSLYKPLIKVTPKDYTVKYNFWADSDMSKYSNQTLDSMDNHSVNLDLVHHNYSRYEMWENRCQQITYRIVVSGSSICSFADRIKNITLVMRQYEDNGTLDQWRGFVADIEGEVFMHNSCCSTWDEGIAVYNDLFDWLDNQSQVRGKEIEMECVGWDYQCIDSVDGDDNLQMQYQLPAYSPERWTVYAPMVYRCWFDEEYGTPPSGASSDSRENWETCYRIYAQLTQLTGMFPREKVGIYLGITNCTCYGADIDQYESVYWGPEGGFWNLVRDVLICKHFGVNEVTFFLAWNAWDPSGFLMGGVFDSYGETFLDDLDQYVNGPDAPDSFFIEYRFKDGRCFDKMALDFVYDAAYWRGQLELALYMVAGVLIPTMSLVLRRRKREQSR
ncbi:MAG: hypothetical protein ACFFCS_08730 [Candidatus Hodarchaeota archaeon]